MSDGIEAAEVFVGIDVGKSFHHAVALARDGTVLLHRQLANGEPDVRTLIEELASAGSLLIVVDQPSDIGALIIAVARDMDVRVAHLPGIAMRRLADIHPGSSKSDGRDAYIIAQAARTLPHALRPIPTDRGRVADLRMLCSYDDDLLTQVNGTTNRLRSLLTRTHPALERVIGPRLSHPAILNLLLVYPSPERLRAVGRDDVEQRLLPLAPKIGAAVAAEIEAAVNSQTLVLPGATAAASIVFRLTEQLQAVRRQRGEIAAQIAWLVEHHELYPILASMPGIGVGTSARILAELSGRSFPSAGHLAAYVGIAPVSRRSGTSIRRELRSERGIRLLKRALRVSAFTAVRSDPVSRSYYERKLSQGKSSNEAIVALMRRRLDVLYAMMRDGRPYGALGIPEGVQVAAPPIRREHRAKRGPGGHDREALPTRYGWALARLRADGLFRCDVAHLPEPLADFRRGLRRAGQDAGLRVVTLLRADQLVAELPDFKNSDEYMRALSDSMGDAAARAIAAASRLATAQGLKVRTPRLERPTRYQ